MSNKKLFENNTDSSTLWWNQTREIISIVLIDENGFLLEKSKIHPMNYIFVPAKATIKLLLED